MAVGEQIFDVDGERYTFVLGNAAQCRLEEQYDKGYFAIIADALPLETITPEMLADPIQMIGLAKKLRVSVLRDIAEAGLYKHHPNLTLADVSEIIDEMGQDAFGDMIGKAIAGAQDKGGGGDATGGKPRKPGSRKSAPTGQR